MATVGAKGLVHSLTRRFTYLFTYLHRDVTKGADLKDGEEGLPERVEVATRLVDERIEVELSAEQLHAEQSEDDDEEEE